MDEDTLYDLAEKCYTVYQEYLKACNDFTLSSWHFASTKDRQKWVDAVRAKYEEVLSMKYPQGIQYRSEAQKTFINDIVNSNIRVN